ncbi:MAG: hypothetical protein QM765_37505 [Myxococcales bacterium]
MSDGAQQCRAWEIELASASSPEELAEGARSHLETCENCRRAFEQARGFWSPAAEAMPGSAELKARVMTMAAAEARSAAQAKVVPPARRKPLWRHPAAWVALAAAASIAAWLFFGPKTVPECQPIAEQPPKAVGFGLAGGASGDAGAPESPRRQPSVAPPRLNDER